MPPVSPNTTEGFAAELTHAVDGALPSSVLQAARRRLHRKALVIAAWYLASYVAVLLCSGVVEGVLACLSLAFAMAAVGFNIQHDANHNAFFDTGGTVRLTRANRVVGWSMYALGADAGRWVYDHGTLHHSAPNIAGIDTDIDLFGLARLAPAQPHRALHRFQHLYVWLLYGFIPLEIMMSDLRGHLNEVFHPTTRRPRPSPLTLTMAVVTKLVAIVALLVVPMLFHPWWCVALGAAGAVFVLGLLLGIIFQPAHVVEEAAWAERDHRQPGRWHEWQVRTSIDFSHGTSPGSRALRWYIGGLDHQTEHHLFPRLPHTVYPQIAPVVTAVCERFGIPRQVHPTLRSALASHYRHLQAMGRPSAPV